MSRDPALTTEVMKLCNSVRFRGELPVTDMSEATARLGFSEVYRVIMMTSASRTISLENVETVLEVEALCRHSVATAVAAETIARTTGEVADAAFMAGLLHDVGKIALASAHGVSYKTMAFEVKKQGSSLSEMEKRNFSFDHSEVGSRLLDRWGFPPEVVGAVCHHHHVAEAGEFVRLTATVALGDALAREEEKSQAGDARSVENRARAIAILQLDPERLAGVMDQARESLKRDAELLKALPGKGRAC